MRVIFAKTLLVVFLAVLPFQQAQSQPAPSTDSGTTVFLYRISAFYSVYVSYFCQSPTDHCLRVAGASAFFTTVLSYPVQGYARQRCNKSEGESVWCSTPGAERDLYLRQ